MSFFTFSADLPHQLAAVNNVAELFDGLDKRDAAASFLNVEDIIGNADECDDLADDLIEENLHRIQSAHNAEQPEASVVVGRLARDDGAMLEGVSVDAHSCPHFTIEMETGTGKTYVYLRTMLELHRRYGFTKFIVVVPSVAILEGVKKAFDDMRDHFKGLFGATNFSRRVYDGGKPGIIPAFARDVFPSLLVMTQQSFNRANNNLYKANDSVISELKPYQWLQRTRPIVILDEPQNMGSEKSKESIRTLRPLFVLRYSATHRQDDQPNPVYRLTPVQAFRLGLVKHVQVTGIAELGIKGKSTLRLLDVTRKPLRAKVRALCLERNHETRVKELTFKQNEAIIKQTKLPEHEGLKVANIRAAGEGLPAAIELDGGGDGGRVLTTEDDLQGSSEQAWKLQIEETIRSHFARQRELKKHGVKVLSLFFIDRVANYAGDNPRIKNLFDECFDRLKKEEPDFKDFAAEEVREAYFAKTTKKKKGGGEEETFLDEVKEGSSEAKEAFELIMRKKEVLLSFPKESQPGSQVAFLFAHSALREGWDNPNVFQICTLNQTVSVMKKRQEIGRGLRLCVNQQGQRLTDPALNVLTVIANESYENYVRALQTEYREAGDQAPPAPTRPGKAVAKRRDDLAQNPFFKQFWERLCQRLEYTIDVDTEALIGEATAKLNDTGATPFPKPMLAVTRGRFVVVEYTLEFLKVLGDGRAQLRLRELSSEGEVQLGLVPAHERLINVEVDTDLGKLTNNPHLRGFKVMEIGRHLGEMRVRFTNEVTISESETHHFSGTRLDNNPTRQVAAARVDQPIPDFFGRAAEETFLTRATLWKIFQGVSEGQKETLFAHPEGWANTFVRVVADVVKDHIVDRLRFRDTGARDEDIGPIDLVFPEQQDQVQRELVDGGPTSLYDKVQVDSDVERTFVNEHLRPDEENLVVYFKFPPRFRIGLPRIIGNYNPDWGVLRHEKGAPVSLELVRETKGGDDLDKLRFLNEGRKLVLAERYFATLGIDYRFVSPKVDQYWESRATVAKQKKKATIASEPTGVPVLVYDLQAAATAFSEGQDPTVLGRVYVEPRKARRPGLFVAKIVGDSMNKVAPNGAWCLWQHLGDEAAPPAAFGEYLLVRREDPGDPHLGGFTFKRWDVSDEGARLSPVSRDRAFKAIELTPDDEETTQHIARFIEVLHIDDSEVTP
jgi:type III restriction enzyme